MKGTVRLDLSEYLELKEFRERIEGGEYHSVTPKCNEFHLFTGNITTYYTKKELAEEFTKENVSLMNEVLDLQKRLGVVDRKNRDLKRMSFWQLRKWWKKNRYRCYV
jgi:hypothetical protein